jgi:formylglycine-generating enzyme required for sulfatase activity
MKIVLVAATMLLSSCASLPKTTSYVVGGTFRHCPSCPEMIVVPAGEFAMGSPPDEVNRGDDESPQRTVTLNHDFACGVFEVTFDEWQACFEDQGCSHDPVDNGWGRGRQPVTNVSWLDAKQYVSWLSEETGQEYRLLTEAEWEYVARAGSIGRFWWGDDSPKGRAVCAGCNLDGSPNIAKPVGSHAPNPFGLFDVHGNVWEWVEDCWSKDYRDHPTDGVAWEPAGRCKRRVLRGGAWPNGGRQLRSANRSWKGPNHRSMNGKGFRVAMTLPH